jgi:hypothetical protein
MGCREAPGQLTCDQDHNYTDEQTALDGGAMERATEPASVTSGTPNADHTPNRQNETRDFHQLSAITSSTTQ